MAYVEVNGARLWVEEAGQGVPVVFVHAGVSDRRMWGPQVAALRDRYRVITYDQRGYGRSDRAIQPFSYADDLLGLLDALALPKVALVGASMGGAAALDVALDHPERVSSLMLLGSAISGNEFTDTAALARYHQVSLARQHGDAEGALEAELDLWYAGVGRALDDVDLAVLALGRDMLAACHRSPVDEALERPPARPAIKRLRELRVPTLAFVGAHDLPDVQAATKLIVAAGAREVVVDGAAHFPSLEHPDLVNGWLGEHLANTIKGTRAARS